MEEWPADGFVVAEGGAPPEEAVRGKHSRADEC